MKGLRGMVPATSARDVCAEVRKARAPRVRVGASVQEHQLARDTGLAGGGTSPAAAGDEGPRRQLGSLDRPVLQSVDRRTRGTSRPWRPGPQQKGASADGGNALPHVEGAHESREALLMRSWSGLITPPAETAVERRRRGMAAVESIESTQLVLQRGPASSGHHATGIGAIRRCEGPSSADCRTRWWRGWRCAWKWRSCRWGHSLDDRRFHGMKAWSGA